MPVLPIEGAIRLFAARDEQNEHIAKTATHSVGEGAVVGIAVGVAVMIVIISGITLLILLRRRHDNRDITEIIGRPHPSQESVSRVLPDHEKQPGRFVV